MNCKQLTLLLCAWVSALQAEVSEHVQWRYYPVPALAGQSLLASLNAASPVREGGQIYHGYTRWSVDWRFYWFEQGSGRCAMRQVKTELKGSITLPAGDGGLARDPRFRQYLAALRVHEEGHLAIGLEAAQAIDRAIAAMPEMPSCALLQAQANATAQRLLEAAKQKERDYDLRTGHGRSQGAWLPR